MMPVYRGGGKVTKVGAIIDWLRRILNRGTKDQGGA